MQTQNHRPDTIELPGLFICSNEEETLALGMSFSGFLGKGGIVALKGSLGSGKTCFAKGIAKGLGIKETVTSPTYTIISEYECVIAGEIVPFYHIDAYRLSGNDDFSSIGGKEIIYGNGISVIEWSELIPDFIPPEAYTVDIEILSDGTRRISIYKTGDRDENSGY